MVLPIIAYGDPILKKRALEIEKNYPDLQKLIADMFETLENAIGVGLAAPQIGLPIRLFVVDASPFEDEEPELKNFKKVFINAEIIEENGKEWLFNEGCLSFPGIREDVYRKPEITIRYFDENFVEHVDKIKGYAARVIQHENDHINGVVFIDKINSLKKQLIRRRLNNILAGNVDVKYKTKFVLSKRKI
ncbi:MAG: peptide deformylase [Bacteroidota bacterium]|nr:peptide deformylase [Bacteroidota bacterium]